MGQVIVDSDKNAATLIRQEAVDLVCLCLSGDPVKGFAALKSLREKTDVPIIILSSSSRESDRIMAFELGCDDYLVPPYSFKEIALRIKARIRRDRALSSDSQTVRYVNGNEEMALDMQGHGATLQGRDMDFTVSEWKIFTLLVENANTVLPRQRILERCFGYLSESYDRVVDTHVKNIRSKLGPTGKSWIETARGYGYRFCGRKA